MKKKIDVRDKENLDVPDVVAQLGINLTAGYKLVKQKDFPSIKIGKRIIIPKAAFEKWLEQAALDKRSYDIGKQQ